MPRVRRRDREIAQIPWLGFFGDFLAETRKLPRREAGCTCRLFVYNAYLVVSSLTRSVSSPRCHSEGAKRPWESQHSPQYRTSVSFTLGFHAISQNARTNFHRKPMFAPPALRARWGLGRWLELREQFTQTLPSRLFGYFLGGTRKYRRRQEDR